jgi:hypothetical protein
MNIIKTLVLFISSIFVFNYSFQNHKDFAVRTSLVSSPTEYVTAEEFGANGMDYEDDTKSLQNAIDYAQQNKIGKVKLIGQREYLLKAPIILKNGVELEMGQNTKILIDGNFRAIEVQNNASITNGIIMVVNPSFASQVIYFDGKYKFSSWDRAHVTNVTIINASESYKGTALSLFAGGEGHFISFVNFTNINILNFRNGIELRAVKPSNGYSWINANRFDNITLDNCSNSIDLIGSKTIPNETSGNQFREIQIQVESATVSILRVSGQDNTFDIMVWDIGNVGTRKIVTLTANSIGTKVNFNLNPNYVSNTGINNVVSTPYTQ